MEEKHIELSDSIPRASAAGRADEENTIAIVLGKKGSGKSAWVEEVLCKNIDRLFVYDSLCKDYGNPDFCKATGISYDLVSDSPAEILKFIGGREKFRVVARCAKSEMERLFFLMRFDTHKKRAALSNTTFLIEEISLYMTAGAVHPDIENQLQYGRHCHNNLIAIARVPKELNTLLRGMSDFIISFQQQEKNAIDFFKEYDPVAADKLRVLPRGEMLLFKGEEADLVDFIINGQ